MNELEYKKTNGWKDCDKSAVFQFCEGYKSFLNEGKTERECVNAAQSLALSHGFSDFNTVTGLKAGDKVMITNRGKNILLAVMGKKPMEDGVRLIGAHIDSPRLDLKQNPLYDDSGAAFLRTHYYGGIKKYQWTTIPLAIHGVVVRKDGSKVEIKIGDEGSDVCFTVTDLLIHLAAEQMKKPLQSGIEGENLQVICGSIPEFEDDKENIKLALLHVLKQEYGICEEDFVSAELEVVPSFNAKDIGFDRGIVGSYGQDDRVCAYTALSAVLEAANPEYTAVCLLVDKEEIGSMGDTGMQSRFFENALAELIAKEGDYSDLKLRRCLSNSKCLSSDVSAAVDPLYAQVHDKQNAPILGCGTIITKFTGSRGKGGSNDASAEFVGEIRKLFNDNNVVWQTGELGKVDAGGGGTIAQFTANLNMQTIDIGVPILCMHSPFELASKVDIYNTYLAYQAFYK